MQITSTKEASKLTLAIDGRIDTTTAPQLQSTLTESLPGVTELVLDFTNVAYISSAGLRVLLAAQKQMNAVGTMEILHANESIMEIFDVTGFTDILTIH